MAKKPVNTSRRKHFGEKDKAWLHVEISADAQQAFLRELSFGGDNSVGLEDILNALADHYHITSGIDEDMLDQVVVQATAAPYKTYTGRGDVVIAREARPEPARDGHVHYKFLDLVTRRTNLPYAELKAAFERAELQAVLGAELQVRPVSPNAELAVLIPPEKGKPGQDIFGYITTMVPNPKRAHLQAGPHVEILDDVSVSEIYGYACVLEDEISVIPPIWVSPDGFEAHYIHFPQVGPHLLPQAEWLAQILTLKQIQQEIPARTVQHLLRRLTDDRSKKGSFLLLQGTAPVPGDDAYLDCKFDPGTSVGRVLGDGSVDLTARKSAVGVNTDQLLAEVIWPTKGQPGVNLRGEEIPAPDGRMATFTAGENVRVEYEGNHPKRFYAAISGNAYVEGTTIEVNPVLQVDGDVDEKTGNIDAVKDLEISGSVRSGLKINASGSITIAGVVEEGAFVSAKGDVVAAHGIIGSDTKVLALGSVETKFIQESSVMARHNICVGDHIFNGRVRAGGELIVQPGDGPRSGSIIGGEASAGKGLEAEIVGSPSAHHTTIGIGPDMEIEAQLTKLGKSIDFCNSNILRIFRTMNIQDLDPALIEDLIRRTPAGQKKNIVGLLKKLKELVAYRDQSFKNQQRLKTQLTRTLEKAEIKVNQKAYADVQIRIGDSSQTIPEDLERPVFFLSPDGVSWRQSVEDADGVEEENHQNDDQPEENPQNDDQA